MTEKSYKVGYEAHLDGLRRPSPIPNAGVRPARLISARPKEVETHAPAKNAAKHIWEKGSPALTSDDLECLWAIARRATIQDRLVLARGRQLQDLGLILISHGWPVLTARGRRLLDDLSIRMTLDLYREFDTDSDPV